MSRSITNKLNNSVKENGFDMDLQFLGPRSSSGLAVRRIQFLKGWSCALHDLVAYSACSFSQFQARPDKLLYLPAKRKSAISSAASHGPHALAVVPAAFTAMGIASNSWSKHELLPAFADSSVLL